MRNLRSFFSCICLCLFLCLIIAGCSDAQQPEEVIHADEEDNPALAYWREYYPDNRLILWNQGDITGNGRKDAVFIFNIGFRDNGMIVVLNYPEGFELTEEFPGPISNQTIEFRDIDGNPPDELVITGTKGVYAGFGIFRMEGGELINLFPYDYEMCC